MSLDFPAFALALWAAYDAGQLPRPEYVLPVLYTESGFASVQNFAGAPYYGIGQDSGAQLERQGIDPSDYLTWPASAQLSTVIAPRYALIQKQFGAINSGTSAYLANFLPAKLGGSRSLGTVLATRGDGSSWYESNAGLDYTGKGTITIGDLAHFISKAASAQPVRDAIEQTYAQRPGESPTDPVWGTEYLWQRAKPAVGIVVMLAGSVFLARSLNKGDFPRWR